eukprot:scaffold6634_cov158-Amphora_coffeaeformis.AAC.20
MNREKVGEAVASNFVDGFGLARGSVVELTKSRAFFCREIVNPPTAGPANSWYGTLQSIMSVKAEAMRYVLFRNR